MSCALDVGFATATIVGHCVATLQILAVLPCGFVPTACATAPGTPDNARMPASAAKHLDAIRTAVRPRTP